MNNFYYPKLILEIPSHFMFGIELEFTDIPLDIVKDFINFSKVKGEFIDYDVIPDSTVSVANENLEIIGGEISSPILTDNPKTLRELKKLCNILNDLGAGINDTCSFHIHFDKNVLNNNKSLIRFLKLWSIYEDIIFKFSSGVDRQLHKSVQKRCKEIRSTFKNIMDNNNNDIVNKIYSTFSGKTNAIRFTDFNTLEIRIPNGTLNIEVIKNNILFFSNLFVYSNSTNFDEEQINTDFNNIDYSKPVFDIYNNLNLEKACKLANMIYRNNEEKEKFLNQYSKCNIKTRTL